MWNPVNHLAPSSVSSSSGHGVVPVPGPLRNFSVGTVASTTLAEAGYTIGTLVSKKDDDQYWEIQKLEDATVTLVALLRLSGLELATYLVAMWESSAAHLRLVARCCLGVQSHVSFAVDG